MSRFANSTVIITGAGSGIGRATALLLAREGARVALVDIDQSGLDATAQLISAAAPETQSICVTTDVTEDCNVRRYVETTVDTYGRIDGFVNNAGVETGSSLLEDVAPEVLARLLAVNLTGAFYGLQHVLSVMRRQGGPAAVVNMASLAGVQGVAQQSVYAATKHALVGVTRSAALEYGRHGIRVNAVAPGGILTPMAIRAMRRVAGDGWESLAAERGSSNPMNHVGQPEDVAGPVAFLLSSEAAFVNGVVLSVDGGQSAGDRQ